MTALRARRYRTTATWMVTVVGLSAFIVGFTVSDADYFFKLNKSIDIFSRVYKEVALNYVDEIDPERFMATGIDGMLSALDPYTNFINESEANEIDLITTGMYGGIGVTIGLRDNFITVITLMDGYSAQRQGILPGDRILEIDGKTLAGLKPEAVRHLTRGEPGSAIKLKVVREGEPDPFLFTLTREEIHLRNITYADFVEPGIAYLKLERFSRGAGDEVRMHLRDLRLRHEIEGVILDLRGNPGGLLDAAVDVVGQFVPKGSLIVSTRGRKPDSERRYYAVEEPFLPRVPLIVLVDRGSASASEIVAGAIQDLDRGVVLGERSFGKGLVQTVVPLAYNAQLKITTAKYYTPSGRCIQEIDYLRKDSNGSYSVVADSLRQKFVTARGRWVYEHGGIRPDTIVAEPEAGSLQRALIDKMMYFKFTTAYTSGKQVAPSSFNDAELLSEFEDYLEKQNFSFMSEGESLVTRLSGVLERDRAAPALKASVERLRSELAAEREKEFQRWHAQILRSLKVEFMSRYNGEKGRIAASIEDDMQLIVARTLIATPAKYISLLSLN